jgi:O-antigen ligase
LLFFSLFSFPLLYLLGLLYTSNILVGLSNLETKIWFFIAPLIIFSYDKTDLTKERCQHLIIVFIISCTVMTLSNIFYSLYQYITTNNSYSLFYIKATHFPFQHPTHPSYLALYLTFAFSAIFHFLFVSKVTLKKWIKTIFLLSLPIFTLFIYFLQSKAGIIVFIFIFFINILYIINRKRRRIGSSFVFFILTFGFVFLLFYFEPGPLKRMKTAMQSILTEEDTQVVGSVSSRIYIWENSLQVINQHLCFGVGSGDANDVLHEEFLKNNQTTLYDRNFNAHNQYLQTTMTLGILGLTTLLSFFVIPAIYCIKKKKLLYLTFIIIIFLHLFVESMFERGAGASFIALFSTLLCFI